AQPAPATRRSPVARSRPPGDRARAAPRSPPGRCRRATARRRCSPGLPRALAGWPRELAAALVSIDGALSRVGNVLEESVAQLERGRRAGASARLVTVE